MKHLRACKLFIQSRNQGTTLVLSRIAGTCEYDTCGRFRRPFDLDICQSARGHCFEDRRQVRFQAHQDGLSLGISKTYVVLKHLRTLFSQHQSNEEDSAKWKAFFTCSSERWFHNLSSNSRQQRLTEN